MSHTILSTGEWNVNWDSGDSNSHRSTDFEAAFQIGTLVTQHNHITSPNGIVTDWNGVSQFYQVVFFEQHEKVATIHGKNLILSNPLLIINLRK